MVKKIFFVSFFFASLIILVMVLSKKGGNVDAQVQGNSFFEGLKIISKKQGITDWVLWAKRADMSRDGRQAMLSGIEINLAKQGMIVSADKGLYDMETRQISVEGLLQASNSNYTLTTSQAHINGSKGTFDTAGEVTIKGKKFELKGKGMQAENTSHKVRILKDVKATFNR